MIDSWASLTAAYFQPFTHRLISGGDGVGLSHRTSILRTKEVACGGLKACLSPEDRSQQLQPFIIPLVQLLALSSKLR